MKNSIKTLIRHAALVALICAGQGATAQDVQENPFDLPDEQPSLGDVSDATERDSLTSIAAATALEQVHARLSAEDQASIQDYEDFIETGVMNDTMRAFFDGLVEDYHSGVLDGQPALKAKVAEMIVNDAIIDLLTE